MKILVLDGSPKQNSDTMHITNAFLNGVNEVSSNEIKVVKVIEKKINACKGCLACMYSEEIKCVQTDDMAEILQDIVESDMVIWSFPLYCYGMPSHLKAVLDRILPLNNIDMKQVDGRTVHTGKCEFSHKKYVMISGCGFPNFENNFKAAIIQFENCFRGNKAIICVPEAPIFSAKEAESLTVPYLKKVEKAGAEFAKNDYISAETQQELSVPMLPNEEYINIVNGSK